jgi:hypothetical protein
MPREGFEVVRHTRARVQVTQRGCGHLGRGYAAADAEVGLRFQVEQLRALENGMRMRVVLCDYRGRTHWSIDSPSDLAEAEAIIAREGELLARYDGTQRGI